MFSCTICGRSFDSSRGLSNHMRVHTKNDYKENGDSCHPQKSGKGCRASSQVCSELKKEAAVKKICTICNKTFDTQRGLSQHISRSHKEDKEPSPSAASRKFEYGNASCPFCNKTFDTQRGLSQHISRSHKEDKEPSPSAASRKFEEANVTCPFCNKTFDTQRGLSQHISRSHKEDKEPSPSAASRKFEDGNASCPFCNKTFDTQRGLSQHISRSHKEDKEPSPSAASRKFEDGNASCPFCNKTFDTQRGLSQHISRSHKEDKEPSPSAASRKFEDGNASCPFCNKTFDTQRGLSQHISRSHKEDKEPSPSAASRKFEDGNASCPLCNKTFDTQRGLSQHISRSHKEDKEPSPSAVSRKFEDGNESCPFCNKTFDTQRGLSQHISRSHKEDKEPSPSAASRKFEDGNASCPFCNKTFDTQRGLSQHISRSHKEDKELSPSAASRKFEEANVTCPFCGRAFDTQHGLNQHISRFHVEEKDKVDRNGIAPEDPSICPWCYASFGTYRGLTQHISKSHREIESNSHHQHRFPERNVRELNGEGDAICKVGEHKKVYCGLCDQYFETGKCLDIHWGKKHKAIEKHPNYYITGDTAEGINEAKPCAAGSFHDEVLYRRGRDAPNGTTRSISDGSSSSSHECFCCEMSFDSDFKLGIHIGKEHLDNLADDKNAANYSPQAFPETFSICKKGLAKLKVDLTLDKEEISGASRFVNEFVDNFQEVLQKYSPFNLDIFRSGSYYDKTKINSPDEFDFMFFPTELKAEPEYCPSLPGYCKIRIHGYIPEPYKELVRNGYLDPGKFKAKMFDIFTKCIKSSDFRKGRRTERYQRPPESPAYTVLYTAVPGKEPIDIDLVPSIQFAGWPKVARKLKPHWIKKKHAESAMLNYHAVTKDCPEEVKDKSLLWRISFSSAEKVLVLYANNGDRGSPRKDVFRMMKMLIHKIKKEHDGKIQKFCSYHLKMFMLNEFDSWRSRQFKAIDKQALVQQTISRLITCIQSDNPKILNYFVRNDNVTRFIPREERQILCQCLERYVHD